MTKRKAIETAIRRARAQVDDSTRKLSISALSAEYAYGLGRIAGLREAANILPVAGLLRAGETNRKLRARANALAKEAREK